MTANEPPEKAQKLGEIRLKMRDGSVREYPTQEDKDRGYGTRYRLKYEPGFVVIEQVSRHRISIPASDIAEIEQTAGETGFNN